MRNPLNWSTDKDIRSWLPKLQSHRGLWVHGLQQNSLASIKAAAQAGYEMAEFDVRLTSDDVVILFHDEYIQNKLIKKTTYEELNSLTSITTFEDLLKWFVKTKNFKLNIEIKSRDLLSAKLEKQVCKLIRKYQIEKRVLVSSFNPLSLLKIRLWSPSVYRALLLSLEKGDQDHFLIQSGLLNILCRPHILNLRYQDYSERFRQLAKKIPIVLWTVNEASIYTKIKSEIHGVISDTLTPQDLKEL